MKKSRPRLSRNNWLALALDVLAEEGRAKNRRVELVKMWFGKNFLSYRTLEYCTTYTFNLKLGVAIWESQKYSLSLLL